MKTRTFRIYLADWKRLRVIIPKKRNETVAEYFEKVITYWEANLVKTTDYNGERRLV